MTAYRCACDHVFPSMDAFVDHVSDHHDALDIAVESLLVEAPGPEEVRP